MYKEVDGFLESLSKELKSLRSDISLSIFENKHMVISQYEQKEGAVDRNLSISFQLREELCNELSGKGFFFHIFDPKERRKKYPWVYSGIDLSKVYVYIFSLSKDENLGSIMFILKEEFPLREIEKLVREKVGGILKTIRRIHEKVVINEFVKSSSYSSVETLKAVDSYTYHHSIRVADFSHILALRLGVNSPEILEYAGLIHDLGKLFIPREILFKKGKLTEKEYEEVKKHVYMLDEIFVGNVFMKPIVKIARLHHERLNGSGYMKVTAKDMPLEARILCVADVTDALLHDRPYREALDVRDAIKTLKNMSNSNKLDKSIVEIATRLIEEFYSGITGESISSIFPPSKNVVIKRGNFQFVKTNVLSSNGNFVEIARPENFGVNGDEQVSVATSLMGVNKTFEADIISLNDDSITIRLLETEDKKKYVSIPWKMDFYFVKLKKSQKGLQDVWNENEKILATSTMIGGNGVSFLSDEDVKVGDVIVGKLMGYEMTAIFVSMVYNKTETMPSVFKYDAEYLPMPEKNLTQIFKLIFKRQVAVKMAAKNTF